MARRERNRVVVGAVAVAILAAALYAPAALLAPLPPTSGEPEAAGSSHPDAATPALSDLGTSGVTLGPTATPIAAGSTDPVPMAAAAKLVTTLVVLDARPLDAGRSGPGIPVTAEDFQTYSRYVGEGTRAVRVVTGDQWSQRETLQATLIASSNNHAEMLARWAFGSVDAYLDAADAWLAANGFEQTSVADPTGLSAASVSTGADLARLAAAAMADPLIAEIVGTSSATTLRGATFENTIAYRSGDGMTGISRSYTDEAGVCLLFAYPADVGGETVTVYGAFAGQPSYDDLDAEVARLIASLPSSLVLHESIVAGEAYGVYETAWGQRASAVARESASGPGWLGDESASVTVELDDVVTARSGQAVGRATVATLFGERTVALELDRALRDPGPLWRLTHPTVVVPAFVEMLTG